MSHAPENLRFLLWRNQVKREDWATRLATWVKSDARRAEDLLRGVELQPDEQEAIAQAVEISVEEMTNISLVAANGVNVLQENIRFLTDHLSYGEKKRLAVALDIHPSTLSKWRSGELSPRKAHLDALCRHFALPLSTNLGADLLFLSRWSLSEREREERAWVQRRIMTLDTKTWYALYPALKLLLAANEDDVVLESEGIPTVSRRGV